MKFFELLPKTHIDFIGIRKTFFVISGAIMLACLASVFFKGMNYGIDFTGGTMVQVQFEKDIAIAQVRNAVADAKINADIQTFVGKNAFAVRVKGRQENVNEISSAIEAALKTTQTPFNIEQIDFVGPTVGNHLAKKAIFAFVLAMGAMVIYIGFRFQNIIWGAMAVAALFHDVFLTIGLFSFLHLEVDLVIVAAFLTIAGFSVNDTIVIFDRVRENIKINPKMPLKDLLNLSVNDTLSRTIITSLTVIAATAILFFMGGPVLRNFSLAMLVGLISGTYSTVMLVPGLVFQWTKDGDYSAMSGEQKVQNQAESGFQNPQKKSKKRYG